MRPEAAPQLKTFAQVGDRPYPVVTGPAGDAVVSGQVAPERRPSTDGTLSGRVVDARGEPVPGARVRLAADGAGRGRLSNVETDKAGGFTIRGLRPGSSYTVIAEYDDERTTLASRVQAEAPDDRVRIELPDETPENGPTYGGPKRGVGRVSDPRPRPNRGEEPPLRINTSDVDRPPAAEAHTLPDEPDADDSSYVRRPAARAPSSSAWRPSDDAVRDRHPSGDQLRPAPDIDRSLNGRGALPGELEPVEEDDRGPLLPPARERPLSQMERERPRQESVAEQPKADDDASGAASVRRAPPVLDFHFADRVPRATTQPAESDRHEPLPRGDSAPAPGTTDTPAELPPTTPQSTPEVPRDLSESAPASTPETTGDSMGSTTASAEGPLLELPTTSSDEAPTPEAQQPEGLRPIDQPPPASAPNEPLIVPAPEFPPTTAPTPTTEETSNPTGPGEKTTQRKVTWGELAARNQGPTKGPERSPVVSSETPSRRASALPSLALNRRNKTEKSRSTGEGEARPAKTKPDEVACRYDPVENRIVDFQFKDVSGRDVRLQDFDADLILLDFWGTWCSPCRDAIPHLVELQKRYGAKHLRVIGIAYEQAPAERRASLVSDTGRKLNVNYPLLIGPTETPCPLREALHVQVYPTMVLLDREGRVLWRQEGNTAQVMARLGRKIDIALKEGVSDETTRR